MATDRRTRPGGDDAGAGGRMGRLRHRVLCGWLHVHSGPIESYGHLSYIDCVRCGGLRQPMPRYYAEYRFGKS